MPRFDDSGNVIASATEPPNSTPPTDTPPGMPAPPPSISAITTVPPAPTSAPVARFDDSGQPIAPSAAEKAGFDPHDIVGSGLKQLGIGAYKGAASTGTGAMKLVKGAATGDFGPFDDPAVQPEIYKPLEADNFLQGTGKVVEQAGEFMVPGSMVEKSIAGTKGVMSAGARIGDAMWKEAASNAGTAFVQTGGDPKAAAAAGVTGGLVRGALSAPLMLRDSKLGAEVLAEAQQFGIPLDRAEQTQSATWKLIKFMASRSIGGAKTMAGFKVERNSMLENVARSIADSVDPNQMDPRSMGQYVQSALDQVRTAAGQELRTATDQITGGATGALRGDLGKVDATTGKYTPSTLVQAARDVIAQHKYQEMHNLLGPAMGGTDNAGDAYSLLQKIANPVDAKITDPIAHAMNPADGITYSVKPVDVATMRELRTLLFDKSAFDTTTTGKAAIQKLNGALHDELVGTLQRNGLSAEAQQFTDASTNYRETMLKLESRVISHLTSKGDMGAQQVVPETIASILRGSAAESTTTELAKIIPPAQMDRVRASLLRQTIEETQNPKGYWDAEKFKKQIDSFGDAGGAAVYGPTLYKELKAFSTAAERYRITPVVASTAAGESMPLLATIKIGGLGGMVTYALTDMLKGSGDAAAVAALTAGGVETLGMRIAARMLTSPSIVQDLTKALAADPVSTVGKQLVSRITAYIGKAAESEKQDNNRAQALERMHRWIHGDKSVPQTPGEPSSTVVAPPPPPAIADRDAFMQQMNAADTSDADAAAIQKRLRQ